MGGMVRCAPMPEQPEIVDEPRPAKRGPQGKGAWFRYSSAASIGIEMAVAIVGCTLFAGWLEREYTHWSPWTTVLGFGVGMGAAIKAIVRTAKQYQRELAEQERERAGRG
jgi:F0F1-type ATP synthase assembly protein I